LWEVAEGLVLAGTMVALHHPAISAEDRRPFDLQAGLVAGDGSVSREVEPGRAGDCLLEALIVQFPVEEFDEQVS
jgi:hypothetical protein